MEFPSRANPARRLEPLAASSILAFLPRTEPEHPDKAKHLLVPSHKLSFSFTRGIEKQTENDLLHN
jgi:hypothetical protein